VSLLFSPAYVPFSLALGLLAALFLLELVALILGASLIGADQGPDLDPGLDAGAAFDVEPGDIPDTGALIAAADSAEVAPEAAEPGGLAGLLGLGATPFMIWFAALLLGFGISGLVLQSLADAVLSATLAPSLAVLVALPLGLGFAKRFARRFARLLPKIETTATSVQFMGGLRGRVSQGVARQGSAAEVRLTDRHGNTHYLRCEPLLPDVEIAEGRDVLTVRLRTSPNSWALRIIAID
jgi:hypothetical protein